MKNRLLLTFALVLLFQSASAQIISSSITKIKHTIKTPKEKVKSENIVYASYNLPFIDYPSDYYDELLKQGVTLGYIRSSQIKNKLSIDFGARITYTNMNLTLSLNEISSSATAVSTKQSYNNLYLAIPVSLAYNQPIGKKSTFKPYVGFNIKSHLMSRYCLTQSYGDQSTEDDFDLYEQNSSLERFQVAAQVGILFKIHKVILSAEYSCDLTELDHELYTSTLAFSLGYCF